MSSIEQSLEKMHNKIAKRKKRSKGKKKVVIRDPDAISDVPELENPTLEDLYDILKKNRKHIIELSNNVKDIKEEIGAFVTLSHLSHVSSTVSDISDRVLEIEDAIENM